MANENQVSIVISPEDKKRIEEYLKGIDAILKPYVVALTPTERRKKAKMGDKTSPFVEKASEYAISNPEFVPVFMKASEFLIDLEAFNTLTAFFRPIEQLSNGLSDTILLCGSEAYASALMYYNAVKQGVKNNIPGAKAIYEDLKKRFERMKAKTPKEISTGTQEV